MGTVRSTFEFDSPCVLFLMKQKLEMFTAIQRNYTLLESLLAVCMCMCVCLEVAIILIL